jgi:hypothetical protein
MPRSTVFPGNRLYPVEISGWDNARNFFVERCDLVWNEDTDKQVALKQDLPDNAVLFVRLLQTGEADRSHPVVYGAEVVGRTECGLHQFRLHAVTPRVKELESSVA